MRTEKEIEMIKMVRRLTTMLGKLGIKCLLEPYSLPGNPTFSSDRPSAYYGFRLKEAADYTHNFLIKRGQKDDKPITYSGRYNS